VAPNEPRRWLGHAPGKRGVRSCRQSDSIPSSSARAARAHPSPSIWRERARRSCSSTPGLHKDPTPGFGITDALRDARNLARAVSSGGDAALVRYWRQRDVDSVDLFHFAKGLADPSYVSPLNRLVYERARESPAIMERLSAQADRELSPYDVVPSGTIMRWVAGAALRGRLSVVTSLFAMGKRNAVVERARAERLALLQ